MNFEVGNAKHLVTITRALLINRAEAAARSMGNQ